MKVNGLRGNSDDASVSAVGVQNLPLRASVSVALDRYFRDLNGETPSDLYNLVLGEVERPLLEAVMHYVNGNKCRAAQVLGINRNTLHKKLKLYDLIG